MALDAGSFSTAGATIQESAQNPAWYQEGLADLLGQGTQLYDLYKNQAQTPYTGQVVAPTTGLQQQAQAGTSTLANQFQSPATIGGLGALQAGANQLGQAGQNFQNLYSQMGSAMTPYQTQLGGLGSQISAAGQYNPAMLSQFTNPYQNQVVDRVATLGNRNLMENLLPGVQSQFSGAGQFGSKRMLDFQNRAMRDTQDSILGQQGQLLNQGYQQAQQSMADWANRNMQGLGQQAGLVGQQAQLGQYGLGQQANLAGQQAQLGGQMGQFGTQQTASGLAANQALNQLGTEDWNRQQQQNAFNLAQWNAQQQAPWQTFGWLSNITRGLQPGQVGGVNYSIPGTTQPMAPSVSQMLGGLGQMASTVR